MPILHANSYEPTLSHLLLAHLLSYTPTLTRLLLHAWTSRLLSTPVLTRLQAAAEKAAAEKAAADAKVPILHA